MGLMVLGDCVAVSFDWIVSGCWILRSGFGLLFVWLVGLLDCGALLGLGLCF